MYMALLTDLTTRPTFDQAKKKKKLEKINSRKDPMNEIINSCKNDLIQFNFFLQEIRIKMAKTWLDEMNKDQRIH